ncbi:MAG: hypothetical protein A2Y38_18790 [Spirochaetes bacterium GWB1_59_5]|nr:MAG: hypothetical protein A2Y38_18790 [Spirochaetes bacterium GWB1_59_5]
MRMTDGETQRFKANAVARLVGLLPFIAHCDDPERTALSHLATFVLAGRGESRAVFDHSAADDVEPLARLRTISDFKGGDDVTIERGMALLCLCMLAGYERDIELDAQLNKYNPLSSGGWSMTETEKRLDVVLSRSADPAIDLVMTEDDALRVYWQD